MCYSILCRRLECHLFVRDGAPGRRGLEPIAGIQLYGWHSTGRGGRGPAVRSCRHHSWQDAALVLAGTVAPRMLWTKPPSQPGRQSVLSAGNETTTRDAARARSTPAAPHPPGSVAAESTHVTRQPTVEVTVALEWEHEYPIAAVEDTGAQVCVAETALLSSLHVRSAQLRRRAGLRDVADL